MNQVHYRFLSFIFFNRFNATPRIRTRANAKRKNRKSYTQATSMHLDRSKRTERPRCASTGWQRTVNLSFLHVAIPVRRCRRNSQLPPLSATAAPAVTAPLSPSPAARVASRDTLGLRRALGALPSTQRRPLCMWAVGRGEGEVRAHGSAR